MGPSHEGGLIKDVKLTYGQVEAQANQLCRYLMAKGITPGSNVSIFLDRSTTFYIAMLAVLKAGCAYVPLDPEHPEDRLKYILEDSNAQVLITWSSLGARLSDVSNVAFIHLDGSQDRHCIQQQSVTRPVVSGTHPDLLCYILYTSGSTGKVSRSTVAVVRSTIVVKLGQPW